MAVSSDIKLTIYNGALRRLGSRKLASLSENREPRRVLDDIWGSADSAVISALEKAEWNFAVRAIELEYSPSVEPGFGFRRAFTKPDDFCRLAALSADAYFRAPLTALQYSDEAGFWLSDYDTLYVKFISSGTAFGLDSSRWTEAFKTYLECDLAWEACERITNSGSKRDRLERDRANALSAAKSRDSMDEGVKFFPRGSWASARVGRGGRAR